MAWTIDDYRRLGDHIVNARIGAGFRKQELFAAATNLTTRTIGDIEKGDLGKRKAFSRETMAVIERAVGWPAGTWRRILDDPNFTPGDVAPALELDLGPLVPDDQDPDMLVLRRPDGISDAQWEALKEEAETHWEWTLERLAKYDLSLAARKIRGWKPSLDTEIPDENQDAGGTESS